MRVPGRVGAVEPLPAGFASGQNAADKAEGRKPAGAPTTRMAEVAHE